MKWTPTQEIDIVSKEVDELKRSKTIYLNLEVEVAKRLLPVPEDMVELECLDGETIKIRLHQAMEQMSLDDLELFIKA